MSHGTSLVQLNLKEIFFYVFHHVELSNVRNSHRRCSVRKGVLRNFAKFTEKHLCQSLFFNKIAGLSRPQASYIFTFYMLKLLVNTYDQIFVIETCYQVEICTNRPHCQMKTDDDVICLFTRPVCILQENASPFNFNYLRDLLVKFSTLYHIH